MMMDREANKMLYVVMHRNKEANETTRVVIMPAKKKGRDVGSAKPKRARRRLILESESGGRGEPTMTKI